MKKGLVFLLALFTCFMVVGCGKKKEETKKPDDPNTPVNNVDVPGKKLENAFEKISLKNEKEEAKYNNLELKFYGEDAKETTQVKDSFKYVLTLKLGDVEINSNVFSNPMSRYINSDNLSSTFTIYAVEDLYILKSSLGAQIDGEYGLVFDNTGNFIRSFEDTSFNVDIDKRTLEMSKCFGSMNSDDCVKASFKISKNTLKINE